MSDLTQQAESAVEQLMKADENQLYEQLGIRAKAMTADLATSSSFEPDVTYDQAQMGLKEDVLDFGKRLFKRWEKQAYQVMCGTDDGGEKDRAAVLNAFGVSDVAVAAALSALLVSTFGLAPAIAAVVAAIAIKRFFRPAYEEFCATWKKSLEAE